MRRNRPQLLLLIDFLCVLCESSALSAVKSSAERRFTHTPDGNRVWPSSFWMLRVLVNRLAAALVVAGFWENCFSDLQRPACQGVGAVKSRINFNTLVDNIVEIKASTCLSALLGQLYTGCTFVSALLQLFLW